MHERLPVALAVAEAEQLVRGGRQRVDIDAVDPDARQVEQRVEHPEGGRERAADPAAAQAAGHGRRVHLVHAEPQPVVVRDGYGRRHLLGKPARGLVA